MLCAHLVRVHCELQSLPSNHELRLLPELSRRCWLCLGLHLRLSHWVFYPLYVFLPLLPVKRASVVSLQPLVYAMHVVVVATCALDGRTVIASVLALVAGHLIGVLADAACCVIGDLPAPRGHCKPRFNFHSHLNYLTKKQ